jgi:hypothetical protein
MVWAGNGMGSVMQNGNFAGFRTRQNPSTGTGWVAWNKFDISIAHEHIVPR